MELEKEIKVKEGEDDVKYIISVVPTGEFSPNQYNFWISRYSNAFGGSAHSVIMFVKGEKKAISLFDKINKNNVRKHYKNVDKIGKKQQGDFYER